MILCSGFFSTTSSFIFLTETNEKSSNNFKIKEISAETPDDYDEINDNTNLDNIVIKIRETKANGEIEENLYGDSDFFDEISEYEKNSTEINSQESADVTVVQVRSRTDHLFNVYAEGTCSWWDTIDHMSMVVYKNDQRFDYWRWDFDDAIAASVEVWYWNYFEPGTIMSCKIVCEDDDGDRDEDWTGDQLIVDDDSYAPQIYRAVRTMDYQNGDLGDYILSVSAYDQNPMSLDVRYKYGENGYVHYFPYVEVGAGYQTANFRIYKSEWMNYQGVPLYWSYYGIDHDNDRPNDWLETGWSVWIDGDLIYQPPPPADARTLLLLHGHDDDTEAMKHFEEDEDISDAYFNIKNLEYYNNPEEMGESFNLDTSIKDIGEAVGNYIINNPDKIRDNLDIVCHSMGGLVARAMIKYYYEDIKQAYINLGRTNFHINRVLTLGTPNHGTELANLLDYFSPVLDTQKREMEIGSEFLLDLNSGDETPYSEDISWFTYSGQLITGYFDGLVPVWSVKLDGAKNRGPYNLNHGELIEISKHEDIRRAVLNDLGVKEATQLKPGEEINLIPTPVELILEIIQEIQTMLELIVEIINPLYPYIIDLIFNPTLSMTLVPGTTNVFEIQFSYPDGIYPYTIIAKDDYGNEVQYYGNLIIEDDDIVAPIIGIIPEHGASFSDEEAIDGINFEWNITDQSGIAHASVELNGVNIASYEEIDDVSDSYLLVTNELGEYTLEITARDNDNDPGHNEAENDWLESYAYRTINIYDDDTEGPELSNLTINHDIHEINISFYAVDDSGIDNIEILVNGEVIEPISQNQMGNTYFFTLKNQWILKYGIYNIEIRLTDADKDRIDDQSTLSYFGNFEITLKNMYDYVDWLIEELKDYVDENLCGIISWSIRHKLNLAQKHLRDAYKLIEQGYISCGLVHDNIAKVLILISEFKTEIFNRISKINDEDALYLINSLKNIRDGIVILMGASVEAEQGYKIALVELDLLHLKDFIEDQIECPYRRCIANIICCASKTLEIAIFKLSLNLNIGNILNSAQWKLKLSKSKINFLLQAGKISEELAQTILLELDQAYENIEFIKESL